MEIAIVGTGNMGTGLAKSFARAGHSVTLISRSDEKAASLAKQISGESGGAVSGATYDLPVTADVVVLATHWWDNIALDAVGKLENLSGKILVDITNPLAKDFMSNTIGHTTSAAEEIAQRAPSVRVVKAFNTVFAESLAEKKQVFGEQRATGFFAGDDAEAKAVVAGLIQDVGFAPLDVGPLKNARYLEPLAQLNIQLGYGLGKGTDVGFKFLERSA